MSKTNKSSIEQEEKPKLTYGQKAVGINFNPSQMGDVDRCKQMAANSIDQMDALRNKEGSSSEQKAMATLAIRKFQEGQMWAVKALTYTE
jgi:hypothetical protein